jgi:hypothetical protein
MGRLPALTLRRVAATRRRRAPIQRQALATRHQRVPIPRQCAVTPDLRLPTPHRAALTLRPAVVMAEEEVEVAGVTTAVAAAVVPEAAVGHRTAVALTDAKSSSCSPPQFWGGLFYADACCDRMSQLLSTGSVY